MRNHLQSALEKIEYAAKKHITREYRNITLDEDECRAIAAALNSQPQAEPVAHAAADYVPVHRTTLIDFKLYFGTDSVVGRSLCHRIDQLLAAPQPQASAKQIANDVARVDRYMKNVEALPLSAYEAWERIRALVAP
jgi:hypothetical protein